MDALITTAIANKKLVSFTYRGLLRIVEPHVYGIHDGKAQLLCYQVRGTSLSGNIPNWRRVELSLAQNIQILDEDFPGRRPAPSGQHSRFDVRLAVVE